MEAPRWRFTLWQEKDAVWKDSNAMPSKIRELLRTSNINSRDDIQNLFNEGLLGGATRNTGQIPLEGLYCYLRRNGQF
jgi:hypothetical protein